MTGKKTINIDGKEYAPEDLSDAVKEQLISLRAAEKEIARLQMQLAIAQTARNAYARAAKSALEG